MSNFQVDSEVLLPPATLALKFADSQDTFIKTLDAYIARIEEGRYGDKTAEVAQSVTELRGTRDDLARAVRDVRSQGKKLGKLAKQPILSHVLRMLDIVIREEAPGTAIHEHLVKARQAVDDGLVDKRIPKPTDDA
ncbi:hypothetical protein [Mycobacteroides abscessus]|uniref:hypothetical protein n=1 Tax=Mycobacteroides abscessus TaxID=36809 RepID=UPI00092A6ADD|nr:hypothetical protein [Mycobacteroides abscessus]SIC22146.1 Uncharacterised protein [Mycobacteroides abscessus subsp. abscessus]